MQKIRYSIFLTLFPFYIVAQQHYDRVTPLVSNPVLVKLSRQRALEKIGPPPVIHIKILKLPFLDDFSKPSPYPDTALWLNGGGVFVNYTYPICPHTLGVATFDGVNAYGLPYYPGASPYSSNPADTLTSQYIGLGSHSPADSIYFSFYWQAGGLGTPPKTNDSLVLEFSDGSAWHEVWHQLGYMPAPTDTAFHYVLIPITQPQYFINAFQFRFRSYSCGAGNLDHWNLDEVYLNGFPRNVYDTAQQDVSFVYESPSLINNYRSEPWEQFTAGDIKSTVFIAQRNNHTSALNTSFYDSVTGPTTMGYSGGANNFCPFYSCGYNSYAPQSTPTIGFPYLSLSGPATWNVTYVLSYPGDFDEWNDTLRYAQVFSNYYAYDDGTAEASYSVENYNSPTVSLACQFTLNHTDTLLGINMFFSYVLANAGNYTFRIAYWSNAGAEPSNTPVYEDTAIYSPKYDSLDQFVYYKFSTPQTVSGTIYVGFIETSGDSVNIGYDWNDNHQNQTFYNADGTWYYSTYTGTPMLRPVFGNMQYNAINEIRSNRTVIQLYPNPANDKVNFNVTMKSQTSITLYGEDGRIYYKNTNFSGNTLNTSTLPIGFYIMQIEPKGAKAQYKKLLIAR